MGKYELFPIEANFNLHSMAKIVAPKGMANVPGSRITMESSKERSITMEYQVKVYKLKEFQDGLYYYDSAFEKSISCVTNTYNAPIDQYFFPKYRRRQQVLF